MIWIICSPNCVYLHRRLHVYTQLPIESTANWAQTEIMEECKRFCLPGHGSNERAVSTLYRHLPNWLQNIQNSNWLCLMQAYPNPQSDPISLKISRRRSSAA